MICNIFKPSRRDKNGKKVRRRLWWGQYRLDGETRITRISLRTPDKQVARGRLDTIVKERQQERDGLIAPQTVRECADRDLSELIDLHADDLEARGRDDEYVRIVRARLKKLARQAGWGSLRDVKAGSFQQWRVTQTYAPKTLNDYLATASSFLEWLMRQEMAVSNPLEKVERVEARGKRVRVRRAFTTDEVQRLITAAPDNRSRLYVTAYYTGLRKKELKQLQWGDVDLDADAPYILARASTTKNRKAARIPLHPCAVTALQAMLTSGITSDQHVFEGMLKEHNLEQFRRDLVAAGIPYRDAQGRVADFHALSRVTPNTHLGQMGVGERIRQEFMRHSDIRLTSSVYTDAEQLPTHAAIMSLPAIKPRSPLKPKRKAPESGPLPEGAFDWVI